MSNIGILAKGALLTSTGTVNTPLPIGTDTFVLVADSAQTLGVKWAAASAGTVTSVSGTLNRITSTGGAAPVIDISASYVGQSSITTLGTVTTGTWNASVVGLTYGGTNANLTASNGGIFYSTATAGAILSGTATAGQILRSGASSAPSWSTATYPSTATGTGTILRADGTNWVATTATYPATTTSQQILYSTAANVVGQLTTANSKFPATNSSGTLAMRALSVVTQVFTASGTYTPTAGMLYCVIEVWGSGGGGGGTNNGGAGLGGGAGGGGAGGYARKTVSAATIGASQTVTINNAGTGGAAGTNNGNTGGTNSVGVIVTATGGVGGIGASAGSVSGSLGGAGGVGTGGDFNANGATGGQGFGVANLGVAGLGASSSIGGGGKGSISGGAAVAGSTATVYGAGGGGASVGNSATSAAGGDGSKGIVVITEYVIA